MFKKLFLIFFMSLLVFIGCFNSTDDYIKDLSSDNPITRRLAGTKLMGRRNDPETVKKVIGLLDRDDERLVFIATQLLGSMADTSAVRPLGKMLDNENHNIREAAAWSLGTIGTSANETAFPYLKKALADSASGVRHAALKSLGILDYTPAVKTIFTMMRDECDSVRAAAVEALYNYRNLENAQIKASDFVVPIKDKSDLVRYITVQALGWESPGGYPDSTVAGELLVEALKDENKHVRLEAIKSIGKNKYKNAVPALKKMFDLATVDEEVAISDAIKRISNEDFPPIEIE